MQFYAQNVLSAQKKAWGARNNFLGNSWAAQNSFSSVSWAVRKRKQFPGVRETVFGVFLWLREKVRGVFRGV